MQYEDSLKRLEEILKEIESKDVGLEKMLKLFDEANLVASKCQSDLNKAKTKIRSILEKNGKIKMSDF